MFKKVVIVCSLLLIVGYFISVGALYEVAVQNVKATQEEFQLSDSNFGFDNSDSLSQTSIEMQSTVRDKKVELEQEYFDASTNLTNYLIPYDHNLFAGVIMLGPLEYAVQSKDYIEKMYGIISLLNDEKAYLSKNLKAGTSF